MMRACTITLNIILLPAVVASNFGNKGCWILLGQKNITAWFHHHLNHALQRSLASPCQLGHLLSQKLKQRLYLLRLVNHVSVIVSWLVDKAGWLWDLDDDDDVVAKMIDFLQWSKKEREIMNLFVNRWLDGEYQGLMMQVSSCSMTGIWRISKLAWSFLAELQLWLRLRSTTLISTWKTTKKCEQRFGPILLVCPPFKYLVFHPFSLFFSSHLGDNQLHYCDALLILM